MTNCRLNDPVFERGLRDFMAVCNVVKTFRNMRILQISTRPYEFWSTMCNEGELLEKFNIQLTPIPMPELTDEMKKAKAEGTEVAKVVEYCRQAAAIPVVCETDIHGAITALLVEAAALDDTRSFFADWTIRHPDIENGELLQHCGPWPISVARETPKLTYPLAFSHPGSITAEAKHGEVTLARFDGDNGEYSMLLGKAKGVDGPKGMGTYLWVEVENIKRLEAKIVEGPYIHHCVGIHKDVVPVLYEACKYMESLNKVALQTPCFLTYYDSRKHGAFFIYTCNKSKFVSSQDVRYGSNIETNPQHVFGVLKEIYIKYKGAKMEKETRKMKLNYAKTIEKWGIFEVTVSGPKERNPFCDQWIKGTFAVKMRRKR